MLETLAELGITPEQLIAGLGALSTAAGAAVVGLIVKLMKVPDRVEALENQIAIFKTEQEAKSKRLFKKARVFEDWILEHEVREDREAPTRVRENMRPDADARDEGDDS